MTMNGRVIPDFVPAYRRGREEQGHVIRAVRHHSERHSEEFMVRNTYIYPPDPRLRTLATFDRYTRTICRNSIDFDFGRSTCKRAGRELVQGNGFTLADGANIVRTHRRGMDVDRFARV